MKETENLGHYHYKSSHCQKRVISRLNPPYTKICLKFDDYELIVSGNRNLGKAGFFVFVFFNMET